MLHKAELQRVTVTVKPVKTGVENTGDQVAALKLCIANILYFLSLSYV